MSAQPTRGPWTLSDGWRPQLSIVDTQNVYGATPAGVVAHVVMASQDGVYSEERQANARLIAEAPAMRDLLNLIAEGDVKLTERHCAAEYSRGFYDCLARLQIKCRLILARIEGA